MLTSGRSNLVESVLFVFCTAFNHHHNHFMRVFIVLALGDQMIDTNWTHLTCPFCPLRCLELLLWWMFLVFIKMWHKDFTLHPLSYVHSYVSPPDRLVLRILIWLSPFPWCKVIWINGWAYIAIPQLIHQRNCPWERYNLKQGTFCN